MNSTCKTAIAAAVAGGYVLGRTRKAKTAFVIGTLLAGRRFGLTPTALAAEGLRRLQENPQLAELREQIGGELLDAVRAAATKSADRRFAAFADTLRERGRAKDSDQEPEDEEPEDEAYEDEEPQDEEEGEEPADRRRGRGHERKRPAKKAAAKKGGPAKKPAAAKKSGPAKKAAGKKTASSRSRSTTSRHGR